MRVSCRGIADFLKVLEARDVSLEGLTDGLAVDRATLGTPSASVEWDVFAQISDRLMERVGGADAYAKLAGDMADDPRAHRVRRFFQLTTSLDSIYRLLFLWMAPAMYPSHTARVTRTGDRDILIELEILPNLRTSAAFFHAARGVAATLPRLHGLPDARVEAEVSPQRATLRVRMPAAVSRRSRALRWWRTLRDAPAVVDELVRQQAELQQTNEELRKNLEDAKKREARLAEEVAARKAAQEALEKRSQELLHAQRVESVGRLASGVAHDFNNLLTAILGQTSMLMDDAAEGTEAREALSEIRAAAERAAAVTSQLLAFGSKQPHVSSIVDLNELVGSMEALLRRLLGDIDVHMRYHPAPLLVEADRTRLEQVVMNLAVNARDAMPAGGTLTVCTSLGGDAERPVAQLIVADNGVGIEEHVASKIFEPFFTTKGTHGTGLGLATVHDIIKDAGGTIAIETELGRGTRFTIDLAIVEGEVELPARRRVRVNRSSRRGTVLIIEDEPSIRRLVARALKRAGHEVLSARDGATALGIVEGKELNVVISDVMLGSERGPAIVSQLLEKHPRATPIFMSGYTCEAYEIPSGVVLLHKPFELHELESRVLDALADAASQPGVR